MTQLERHALPQRILVLDDDAEVGLAVVTLLSGYDIAAQHVQDEQQARQALTQAQSRQAPFNALVCDLRLAAGVDGLEVAQRLQHSFDPPLPLLLVTGETSAQRLQRVHEAGVAVLFKPVAADALLQALINLRRAT